MVHQHIPSERRAEAAKGKGMIIGIGSDLIDMRRIERLLADFGERFIKRLFTEEEIA